MKKSFDPGKWAENEVQQTLEARSKADQRFAFHRYPDSRAARGLIGAQPSDFEVAFKGRCINLEVKETAQPTRLPRAKVPQYGALRKFSWAGKEALVLVYRSHFSDWYIITDRDLFDHGEDTPTSFPFVKERTTYLTAAAAIAEIFQ